MHGTWLAAEYLAIIVVVFLLWTTVGCLGVLLMQAVLRALMRLQRPRSNLPRAIARTRIGV